MHLIIGGGYGGYGGGYGGKKSHQQLNQRKFKNWLIFLCELQVVTLLTTHTDIIIIIMGSVEALGVSEGCSAEFHRQ